MKERKRFEIQDKSIILKWIVIVFCSLFFLSLSSLYIYKAVTSSEWYDQMQLKKAFKEEYLHVTDSDQIIYVGISPQGNEDSWEYFYDTPTNLFADMTCDNFDEIDDPAKVKEILTYDWIMVIFKDASKSIYFISPQEEIYWGTSFVVECPSLLSWYKQNKN